VNLRIPLGVLLTFIGSVVNLPFSAGTDLPGPLGSLYLGRSDGEALVVIVIFVTSWVMIASAGYFFGREWGSPGILVAAIVPALIFYSLVVEAVNLSGGYVHGYGAVYIYLYLPGVVSFFNIISALIGQDRKRAAEKRETDPR
jgi:hypothetical protein